MALYSPGVEVVEKDLSEIIPSTPSSISVYVGNFEKGPIDTYIYLSTVEDLIEVYGEPNEKNYNDWYQVYNFLQYRSGTIAVSRIGGIDLLGIGYLDNNGNIDSNTNLSITNDGDTNEIDWDI